MQRISYTDPHDLIEKIKTKLHEQFPLANLHWSPGDRPLRTIPSLEIKLIPHDNKTQHQILGLSDAPLLQIYIFEADSYDQYKQQRKSIAEWAAAVQNIRDPTGFLIIHFVNDKHRSKSVWHKLIGDYGDHTAQIYLDDADQHSMWNRFSQALKLELLEAFSARVQAFESEIRNLQSTRDIVGWNFGRLFVIKDSLATCFEDMGFLEDAYQIYIELERMGEPDFFTGSKTADISVNIQRLKVLDSMLTQDASAFDFYAYLFQRQVALLVELAAQSTLPSVKDKYLGTAIQRATTWIPKLVQMLQKVVPKQQSDILNWQLEMATYVYSLIESDTSNTVADSRGQLLLLKRDALCTLAAARGFTLPGVPVSLCLDPITLEFPASQGDFEKEFFSITGAAVKDFELTNMSRSAATLKVQLAAIDVERGNNQAALDSLVELLPLYADTKWPTISSEVYRLYLTAAENLDLKEKILEASWLLLQLQPHISTSISTRCVKHVESIPTTVTTSHDPTQWLNINVNPYICGDTRYYVKVNIKRKYDLPFPQLTKGVIHASWENRGKRNLVFTCKDIASGNFYGNQFLEGNLKLTKLVLYIGDQELTHDLDINTQMFQLSSCFNARLDLAKSFTHTKRNLELYISSPEPTNATVKIQAVDRLQILHEKINTTPLQGFTSAIVTVPALVRLEQPLARIQVVIDYDKNCRFEFIKQVDMSFAVLVHVQELFRESMFLNQFLISCTTTMPVFVDQASLSRSKNLDVVEEEQASDDSHVVLDGAPVSLVYMLKHDSQPTGPNELTLRLEYRPAQLECDHLIWERVEPVIKDFKKYNIVLKEALKDLTVDNVAYIIHGRFTIDPTSIDHLVDSLSYIDPAVREGIAKALHLALSGEIQKERQLLELNYSMELLSPEPQIDVVHFVGLEFERKEEYPIGSVIDAKLTIKSSSKWASKPISNAVFFYELDKFNCEGWSFNGPARAKFTLDGIEAKIALIPTKRGVLELPLVEIFSENHLNMETIQKHKSETVWIIGANELALKF